MTTSSKRIRPAARLLKTIGQDLIKDVYAAIVELVKNSYDADSPGVIIGFSYKGESERLTISVNDTGDGMNEDTVTNKWLVPATSDKLDRKRSRNGRVLQGRKGIGRFAAAILGERILMETTSDGITTSLILDMEKLDTIEYLEDFTLDLEVEETDLPNGTTIEIEKDNVSEDDIRDVWNTKQIRKLFVELRSLIAPEDLLNEANREGYEINYSPFSINLKFENFPVAEYKDRTIDIKPFPVLNLFDYRIYGSVNSNGMASLKYENKNIPSLPPEEIEITIPLLGSENLTYPGEIFVDLRVYDRDPENITKLINRGLIDPDSGEKVGKLEARKILDDYYGVGIYREQFRIRPYGEQSFDWLDLDKKRIQDSTKIGHNQIMGFVYIKQEEESNLTEKSARDGLVENSEYFGLQHIVNKVTAQIGVRRYIYREKAQVGSRGRSIDDTVNSLFDFAKINKDIKQGVNGLNLNKSEKDAVEKVFTEALLKEEKKQKVAVKKIKESIAIYQGQATLGKITHVLLHEGRKNIQYITETCPRIVKWSTQLIKSPDKSKQEKLSQRGKSLITHAKALGYLFKRVEPFARTRRSPKKSFYLKDIIESTFSIFSSELESNAISYVIKMDIEDIKVVANEHDLLTVFANLIENSVYWLQHMDDRDRIIEVSILREGQNTIVEYSDNGPGFQGNNVELMFEPGYSMKPEGTGLGLALAGEAMARIGGGIEAVNVENGAFFDIKFIGAN